MTRRLLHFWAGTACSIRQILAGHVRRGLGAVLATILIALPCPSLAGVRVVVPNSLAATEGNNNNGLPFNCAFLFSSVRYQQVFSGSEVGPLTIDTIAFRQDGVPLIAGPWSNRVDRSDDCALVNDRFAGRAEFDILRKYWRRRDNGILR